MSILFELKDIPEYVEIGDRHCRACDDRTRFALEAVGHSHVWPCCADPLCQEDVKNQILDALARQRRRA